MTIAAISPRIAGKVVSLWKSAWRPLRAGVSAIVPNTEWQEHKTYFISLSCDQRKGDIPLIIDKNVYIYYITLCSIIKKVSKYFKQNEYISDTVLRRFKIIVCHRSAKMCWARQVQKSQVNEFSRRSHITSPSIMHTRGAGREKLLSAPSLLFSAPSYQPRDGW